MKKTKGEKVFSVFNYIFLTLLAIITVYPFWDIIRISFSTVQEANTMQFRLFPSEINLEGYKNVMTNKHIWNGYLNTIIRVVLGLSVQMCLMILAAYPLSKKYLPMRSFFTMGIVFTMFFSGGMIPSYLLIRQLDIDNSILALILPRAIDTYSMIILRNFFMTLPEDLEESAKIDGASVPLILIKIILPLSKPILMTVGLWSIIYHWNAWFDCLIYIRDSEKYVLQAVLRKIIIDAAPQFDNIYSVDEGIKPSADIIKCATIIVSTLPIMVVYPFIQKHFVKGVMVGSLKG